MCSCDFLIGVSSNWSGLVRDVCGRVVRRMGGRLRRRGGVVGFEDVEAFQLLVQHCKRLELLGLFHLRLEPVLDLILLFLDEVLVVVVEMSVVVRTTIKAVQYVKRTCSIAEASPARSAHCEHIRQAL
jgi:hypothetical protein